MSLLEEVINMVIALAGGLLIGVERQYSHKAIGFGVFTAVSTGSCILTTMGIILFDSPIAIIAAIITSIGFLGAGAIFRGVGRALGLTTASLLWASAAFGITVGTGIYEAAIGMYSAIWIIILTDRIFERKGIGIHQRLLTILFNDMSVLGDLKSKLSRYIVKIERTSFDKERGEYYLTLAVRFHPRDTEAILAEISKISEVVKVEIT
ncbi:MAG: MgtC/SapB family protein [Promethearchaeota archaeon]